MSHENKAKGEVHEYSEMYEKRFYVLKRLLKEKTVSLSQLVKDYIKDHKLALTKKVEKKASLGGKVLDSQTVETYVRSNVTRSLKKAFRYIADEFENAKLIMREGSKKEKEEVSCLVWDDSCDSKCWKSTEVGGRRKELHPESMSILSELVYDVIKSHGFTTLLVGKGATCWQITSDLLNKGSRIKSIHTGNLQVLCEFIKNGEDAITLHLPHGDIDINSGYYAAIEKCSGFKEPKVQAVLTSFMGLHYDSEEKTVVFIGKEDAEKGDKMMNIRPHETCKAVIVPFEWTKLTKTSPSEMAKVNDFKDEIDYIFVTDIPPYDKSNFEKWDLLEKLLSCPKKIYLRLPFDSLSKSEFPEGFTNIKAYRSEVINQYEN